MALYTIMRPISPWLTRSFPNAATTTERLGRAMINVALAGYPNKVLETSDINTAGTS
jgi:hypothetical protein